MNGPVLFTDRLILRPHKPEDLDDWARFYADEHTTRFLGGVQPRSVAWRSLCAMAGAWTIRGFSMFAVEERGTGRWVGRIGPWEPEGWPGREVGYGLLPEFAGRGYATEAAAAAIDFVVDVLRWNEVVQTIHPDNRASIAVAERLGARHRGPTTLPAPLQAMRVDLWGQSAAEWRARRRA